jgi:uncharacterized membrane protein
MNEYLEILQKNNITKISINKNKITFIQNRTLIEIDVNEDCIMLAKYKDDKTWKKRIDNKLLNRAKCYKSALEIELEEVLKNE